MKPKEKAEELVDKYKFYLGNEQENIKEAKDCALIAVNELQIQAGNQKWGNYLAMQYWLDVEKEIENYEQ
tara:strand:- start:312 stop:521 length:210 start_codon:yes stop_codon:yes gene_type:complete